MKVVRIFRITGILLVLGVVAGLPTSISDPSDLNIYEQAADPGALHQLSEALHFVWRPDIKVGTPDTNQATAEKQKITTLGDRLRALPKGLIAVVAPHFMDVGETRSVEARVGLDVLKEKLAKGVTGTDQLSEGSLGVTPRMVVSLTGANFEIKPVTPEEQTLAEGFPSEWTWNVTALRRGEQELEVTAYAILDENNRQRLESYTAHISVSVAPETWSSWLSSISSSIDTVKTTIITLVSGATALIGWMGIAFARRRQKKPVRASRRPPRRT